MDKLRKHRVNSIHAVTDQTGRGGLKIDRRKHFAEPLLELRGFSSDGSITAERVPIICVLAADNGCPSFKTEGR